MTSRPKSSRLPGAASPAGEATSTGQAGSRTPERVPPARPTFPTCTCGHSIVLHDISKSTKQRTACSITTGLKATRCGCRTFEAAPEPAPGENPS